MKYHVHLYRVIEKREVYIEAQTEFQARLKALEVVESLESMEVTFKWIAQVWRGQSSNLEEPKPERRLHVPAR